MHQVISFVLLLSWKSELHFGFLGIVNKRILRIQHEALQQFLTDFELEIGKKKAVPLDSVEKKELGKRKTIMVL